VNSYLRPAIIFDLDGTIADIRHRLHFVKQKPKDWVSFLDACPDDALNEHVYELYRRCDPAEVIICSGRNESHREQTIAWLVKHGIGFNALLMRQNKDYRPDTVIKLEMLVQIRASQMKPILAIDDRPDVVRMWRRNGVPCLAVDDYSWYEPKPGQTDPLEWLEYMVTQHGKNSMFAAAAEELRKVRLL
jgi:NLI interacting factor-like phosphatase